MADMQDSLGELKAWVRFTDEDSVRLAAAFPLVEPYVHGIMENFYAEILRHEGSRRVLESPEQVERLKKTLRIWLRELMLGPHDEAYAERRRAIGRRHVRVGLPNRYMTMAMHLVENEVLQVLQRSHPDPVAAIDSLNKACCIDLALMTGTYVEGRERLQFDSLQALLVTHLRVAVLMVDHLGMVTSATPLTAKLMTGEATVVGRRWQDALPAGLLEASALEAHVARGLAHRREVTLPRVDLEGPDQRSFRIHVVPLSHDLASFLVQIEELTDAVEMEARLRRSESLAQLGALSAAVAHELRNPLAGISGALQVITRAMDADAPHGKILVKVESEVRRLNDLVTDLLAFARPGKATLQDTDLLQLVREVVELVSTDNPNVQVTIQGRGRARADPNQVRQILHNLVRNAIDAIERRGRICVQVGDGSILVCDDGPGIPREKWEEVFEPFVTTKTRGTGLGLAISARSADAMNGNLRIVEGPLAGACFELTLTTR